VSAGQPCLLDVEERLTRRPVPELGSTSKTRAPQRAEGGDSGASGEAHRPLVSGRDAGRPEGVAVPPLVAEGRARSWTAGQTLLHRSPGLDRRAVDQEVLVRRQRRHMGRPRTAAMAWGPAARSHRTRTNARKALRPRSSISRPRWSAPGQASIATVQRGCSARKRSIWSRRSFLRKTTAPSAAAPCALNTFFARSPITGRPRRWSSRCR